MRQMILGLWVLLLTACLWAQPSSTNKIVKAAIRRAKSLIVISGSPTHAPITGHYFVMTDSGLALAVEAIDSLMVRVSSILSITSFRRRRARSGCLIGER